MDGGVILTTTYLNFPSMTDFTHISKLHNPIFPAKRIGIRCSENSGVVIPLTGGALDFRKATTSLSTDLLSSPKKITLVRHGLSSWNAESRVQGSSDLSVLTDAGAKQAERCREALADIHFDKCFSSPISRAKSTAEILWQGRKEPLIFLDSLKEAHLFFLEGMKNGQPVFADKKEKLNHVQHLEAEDAKQRYPKEYTTWREDPVNFNVDGIYPIKDMWITAAEAWREILSHPGESFLVVTHKSKLRALVCTALGLGPERFRAIDVNNGGICVFNFNKKGEAMLQSLNMTAHMYTNHTYIY
ncbi:putative 2-carboxy-D-arabinitol-1-phosphatase [Bienertia sinuspersici]